jgi:DNA ligase 1
MKYVDVTAMYEKLAKTTKRLEKTHHLALFLRKVSVKDLSSVILLSQGLVFPKWDERKVGLASRLVLKAISQATGYSVEKIESVWKTTGDLGITTEKLISTKKQVTLFNQSLTLQKVLDNLQKLATMEGTGTVNRKVSLVAELLTSATALEAKYIIKTVLGAMRTGLGEGTIRDAIVWAYFWDSIGVTYEVKENKITVEDREKYNVYVNAVQEAYDSANDFGKVALTAKEQGLEGLHKTEIIIGKPIKAMLAIKEDNITDIFKRTGRPAIFEYKIDGFRLQVHKQGKNVKLFTRRLDDVTKQFPEVVKAVQEHVKANQCILDAEAVGYDPTTKNYLPFQTISQRIKRKYDIEDIAKKFPVELHVFDLLYVDGTSLLKEKLKNRRKQLEKIVATKNYVIKPSTLLVTIMDKEAQDFFNKALEEGHEGVMVKVINAPYKPGARVGHMIKWKTSLDLIDVVIIGAEWGKGKRRKWLASFAIACYDHVNGKFLEIGKVGTGLKEKKEEGYSFEEITQLLQPLIVEEEGTTVIVQPQIVIEVDYEELQASPTYSSKYALRFPRFKRLREDKAPEEIITLQEIRKVYGKQRGRHAKTH